MLFKGCAEGEYEPGRTYHDRNACHVFANALYCACMSAAETVLAEVRIEGVIAPSFGAITGKEMTVVRKLTPEERCAAWTGVLVRKDGAQLWYRNGQLHREDGPAAVSGVYRAWHRNGQLHRDDGPAVVCHDGSQLWYRRGIFVKRDSSTQFLHVWRF